MKKWVNGKFYDMTAEEIAEHESACADIPDPTPTIEDRLAKVEEDSSVIRVILMGEDE